jgi:hypothetical protein
LAKHFQEVENIDKIKKNKAFIRQKRLARRVHKTAENKRKGIVKTKKTKTN